MAASSVALRLALLVLAAGAPCTVAGALAADSVGASGASRAGSQRPHRPRRRKLVRREEEFLEGAHAEDEPSGASEALQVPDNIRTLGLSLFGSERALRRVLRRTMPPRELQFGPPDGAQDSMWLVCDREHGWEDLVKDTQADEYRIRELNVGPGFMLDVGANIGTQAIMASKMHKTLRIVALEPVPSAYFYFAWNLQLNKVPLLADDDVGDAEKHGVLPLHRALTKDGRDVEMMWGDGGGTEVATMVPRMGDRRYENSKLTAKVPSLELLSFLESHRIDHVDFLKIDCEGCEFENIPAMKSMLCDGSVGFLSGEMHHRPELHPDLVGVLSQEKIQRTLKVFHQCGCHVTNRWVDCGRPSDRDDGQAEEPAEGGASG